MATALKIKVDWLQAILVIASIVLILVFTMLIYLMQTKYRPQQLSDAHFVEYNKNMFKDFSPVEQKSKTAQIQNANEYGDIEKERIKKYEDNCGLFLVHYWRPSLKPDQVADIAINLKQHKSGPLSEGNISCVEYYLGPMFSDEPLIITEKKHDFRLDISAYGPMLCLAMVKFKDSRPPIILERYIDFPENLGQL